MLARELAFIKAAKNFLDRPSTDVAALASLLSAASELAEIPGSQADWPIGIEIALAVTRGATDGDHVRQYALRAVLKALIEAIEWQASHLSSRAKTNENPYYRRAG